MIYAKQIFFGLQVKIHETPKMNVYVLSYGGWMTSLNEKSKAKALARALDEAGAKYKKGKHYAAGYNRSIKHCVKQKVGKKRNALKVFTCICLLQSHDAVQQTQ